MSDKPILFSGEMVRAILAGQKTQTRRVVRFKTPPVNDGLRIGHWNLPGRFDDYGVIYPVYAIDGGALHEFTKSPYGQPGDLLWVREKQRVNVVSENVLANGNVQRRIHVTYAADGQESPWIIYPDRLKGIPMPGKCLPYGGFRESSRITLTVTAVRVERIQHISEEDARREGVSPSIVGADLDSVKYRAGFMALWDSINAKRGYAWDSNPWVWVIDFERTS